MCGYIVQPKNNPKHVIALEWSDILIYRSTTWRPSKALGFAGRLLEWSSLSFVLCRWCKWAMVFAAAHKICKSLILNSGFKTFRLVFRDENIITKRFYLLKILAQNRLKTDWKARVCSGTVHLRMKFIAIISDFARREAEEEKIIFLQLILQMIAKWGNDDETARKSQIEVFTDDRHRTDYCLFTLMVNKQSLEACKSNQISIHSSFCNVIKLQLQWTWIELLHVLRLNDVDLRLLLNFVFNLASTFKSLPGNQPRKKNYSKRKKGKEKKTQTTIKNSFNWIFVYWKAYNWVRRVLIIESGGLKLKITSIYLMQLMILGDFSFSWKLESHWIYKSNLQTPS